MKRTNMKRSRLLVQAGVLGLVLSSVAYAQQFSFAVDSMDATAGDTLEIPILVSIPGAVPDANAVAGANFTVRISTANNSNVMLSQATSLKGTAGSLAPFTYVDNNDLTRTGVANGTITGNVNEFRGVLYSTSATPATFDASTPIQIATLSVPTNGDADGSFQIELVSAIDNLTGLLGLSNHDGSTSIVPDGQTRPAGDLLTINLTPSIFPVTTDFVPTGNNPSNPWIYTGVQPIFVVGKQPIGEAVASTGLRLTANSQPSLDNIPAINIFDGEMGHGFWGNDRGAGGENPWRIPEAGSLYFAQYTVKSDAVDYETPFIRARALSNNNFFASLILIQDIKGNILNNPSDPVTTPGAAGKTYNLVVETPSYVNDGGLDGFNIFFDILQHSFDTLQGKKNWLESVTERVVDPATLTGESVLYTKTFDGTGTDIFQPLLPGVPIAGRNVTYIDNDARGLGVRGDGGIETTTAKLPYGTWETPAGSLGVTISNTKLYKVEVTFITDATNILLGPVGRIRAWSDGFEFFQETSVSPFADQGTANLPRWDADGETLTLWVQFPATANGKGLNIGMDSVFIYPIDAAEPDDALFAKSVTITEYNAPVFTK